MHLKAALAQGVAKMAHGGKNQRNLVPVVRHVLGFLRHFRQQHLILGRIGAGNGGIGEGQLVTQHQNESGSRHALATRPASGQTTHGARAGNYSCSSSVSPIWRAAISASQ